MRLVAAIVAMTLSACSLSIIGPPQPLPPTGPIVCDQQSGKVGKDIVVGTLLGLLLAGLIKVGGNISDRCPPDDSSCEADESQKDTIKAIALGAAIATPFYVSAFVGSRRLSSCRDVKAATGR